MNENLSFDVPLLTDGGLETSLTHHYGVALRYCAAFDIIGQSKYWNVIYSYYRKYLELAEKCKTGFVLESATWRASLDWGRKLGYTNKELWNLNQLAIEQLKWFRQEFMDRVRLILLSGCIGPRSDGYQYQETMSVTESEEYHSFQIEVFKEAGVDFVTAMTFTYIEEALGVVNGAKKNDLPVVISFQLNEEGKLPSGRFIEEAIDEVDSITDSYPLYYMVNCTNPTHFIDRVQVNSKWTKRIMGIRSKGALMNSNKLEMVSYIDDEEEQLIAWYQLLKSKFPNLMVFGGCYGEEITKLEGMYNKLLNN